MIYLSDDILSLIFDNLSYNELIPLRVVSREWKNIVDRQRRIRGLSKYKQRLKLYVLIQWDRYLSITHSVGRINNSWISTAKPENRPILMF